MKSGKVYLTGGGCGDAGLVTLRAFRLLRSCEVLVYDSLAPEELLSWTAADCEKIYVGKRCGRHSMPQSEINALLVEKAREGKTVVRLKGGDPYVFGRGGEEFLALRQAGIRCEEVPGITSAIAAPAAAGIPATHRGLASSVTVVTGTAAADGAAMDFDVLARLGGTLVILMGMHRLEEIAAGLLAAGKSPDMPCAVIMEGTTARQRCLRALLGRLVQEVRRQGFGSPAVIVVGAVAELELLAEETACAENPRAFCGEMGLKPEVTAGIAGTPRFAARVSAALAAVGIAVCDMGFLELRPNDEPLPDFPEDGWLVFTSPNGVGVFLDKMKRERRDLRALCGRRIAAVGPGTAGGLAEAGLYADYQPERYDTVHLAQGLAARMEEESRQESRGEAVQEEDSKGSAGESGREAGREPGSARAVFLRARQGSPELPRIFREKDIPFRDYPLYDVEVREDRRAAALPQKPDYLIFGSAGSVRAYFEGLTKAGIANDTSRYVCIGARCAEELRRHTAEKPLVAAESSVEAVVECLCRAERGRIRVCTDSEG
ncbi:MAG: uroporphyrinogen-III C-methyltransferase [Muribaculaceae bacterium]|nr:uroporphyrinogen-III C-methyltransferase [Muribaculaceae bacterium]